MLEIDQEGGDEMTTATKEQWYRIDKADGSREAIKETKAIQQAWAFYIDGNLVLEVGKFQTPYAYYEKVIVPS